ncbi:MAG: zinc-ribbon domain-containing protein, partial [Acidobacteria bacterium]|nr:zinc-ribbon domain-containing protein [Acidobacteriota bacterium]
MKANCPQCNTVLMIEDSKVPDRPFGLKCPKCQNLVRLPGRAADAPASASPPASSPVNGSAVAGPGTPQAQGPTSPEALPGPQEVNGPLAAPAARSGSQGSALVALSDRGQAEAMALTLSRQGYTVTNLSDLEDAVRLLEQGVYSV